MDRGPCGVLEIWVRGVQRRMLEAHGALEAQLFCATRKPRDPHMIAECVLNEVQAPRLAISTKATMSARRVASATSNVSAQIFSARCGQERVMPSRSSATMSSFRPNRSSATCVHRARMALIYVHVEPGTVEDKAGAQVADRTPGDRNLQP